MEKINSEFEKINESIKLLSLPYEEQKGKFPSFVDVPFEILDTFDNSFLIFPNLVENGMFTYKVIAMILRLHNIINFTISNPNFKDLEVEQFSNHVEWDRIRNLAGEIVASLEAR